MSSYNAFKRGFLASPVENFYLHTVRYPRVFLMVDPGLDGRVLEIGCGPGKSTAEIHRRLPRATLVATDIDEGMEAWVRKTGGGVEFRVEDATHLSFPDASFDAVFEFNSFHHLDYSKALGEVVRVLRPSGHFYAADVCASAPIGASSPPPRLQIGRPGKIARWLGAGLTKHRALREGWFTREDFVGAMVERGLGVRGVVGRWFIAVHAVRNRL